MPWESCCATWPAKRREPERPVKTQVQSRNLGLDLLRLFAVLLVFGNHLSPPPEAHPLTRGLRQGVEAWMRGGWVGVDVFFVLSGFLVSGLLFTEHRRRGSVRIGTFLLRRGMKIYPAFWVLMLATVAFIWPWLQGTSIALWDFASEVLFIQNYAGHVWIHTWSLAVEEHFYLLLAALVWWLQHRNGKSARSDPFSSLPWIFTGVAAGCLALRLLACLQHPEFSARAVQFPTHLRIDALLFGVLLSYLTHYHQLGDRLRSFRPEWRLLLGCLLLAPPFFLERDSQRWLTVFGYNLFYIGSGLLVLAANEVKSTSSWVLQKLGELGAASYSIYLWHVFVNEGFWKLSWAQAHAGSRTFWLIYLLSFTLGALLFGYLMARVVELPVLKLRERLWPSRLAPAQATAPTRETAIV